MNIYFTLASYALAASLGFGACGVWKNGQISDIKLEAANERISIERAARQAMERYQETVSKAQNEKTDRDSRNRAAAVGAVDSGNGLRITSTATVRAAKEDASTCAKSIAIYDTVLNTMAEAGRRIAAEADQWESDAIMQHEAAKQP